MSSEAIVETVDRLHFADSRYGPQAVMRLRMTFARTQHPMLISDDSRRWVTGNDAACELLGVTADELPWRTIEDFTAPEDRALLKRQWGEALARGAEGWYQLHLPDRGAVAVEFSVTPSVLPGRHLSVLIPADRSHSDISEDSGKVWSPVIAEEGGRLPLTQREREVMTLVAAGLQSNDIAERLFLSPETVKSHVQNAMAKLGAHTRAHAVAIAVVTGQIAWDVQ